MDEDEEVVYTVGQQIELYDAPIYINPTSTKIEEQKTGTFYLWNDRVTNNRIRVCSNESYVGLPGLTVGWIETEDIDRKPTEVPTGTSKPSFTASQKVTLRATKVYATSVADKATAVKTGGFYIWSSAQANNRIRICKDLTHVGRQDQIVGWVNIYEITEA